MKWLLFIIIFCSCAPMYPMSRKLGYIDESNKSIEPYKFIFKGNSDNFNKTIKRFLAENNFSIANDDSLSGIIITNAKTLSEDEMVTSGALRFMNSMNGNEIEDAKGVITILYDKLPNNEITMKLKCSILLKQNNSNWGATTKTTSEKILQQGEPLPMKIKILLLKDTRFGLTK